MDVLDLGLPFCITGLVYGEVLQRARMHTDFERLKKYMSTQRFYHLRDTIVSYEGAARLYYRCRRGGVTLRSTIDCPIVRVAIEHDVSLLHDDSDFVNLGRIISELKLV